MSQIRLLLSPDTAVHNMDSTGSSFDWPALCNTGPSDPSPSNPGPSEQGNSEPGLLNPGHMADTVHLARRQGFPDAEIYRVMLPDAEEATKKYGVDYVQMLRQLTGKAFTPTMAAGPSTSPRTCTLKNHVMLDNTAGPSAPKLKPKLHINRSALR